MPRLKANRVLVPVDFSFTSEKAIKYGACIAKYNNGELILMHVQKQNDLPFDIAAPDTRLINPVEITEILEEKLQQIASNLKKKYRIRVTTILTQGNIISEINNVIKTVKVGFVIMGTQGKGSFNDLFLGSNTYRFLVKTTVPTMTVKAVYNKLSFEKIVIPVDTTHHSKHKISAAIQLAQKLGAELYILGLFHKNSLQEKLKLEIVLHKIKEIATTKNLICSTEISKSENYIKATLDYTTEVKGDLIIAMTDQNTEFSNTILGTYIHHIINESKVPVLCIPPEPKPYLPALKALYMEC